MGSRHLGALETSSGALALYRAELFYDHLDAYEAGVVTDMPTTLGRT
ncbi:hypothetical protein [Streptomyces sp. NPDC047061]